MGPRNGGPRRLCSSCSLWQVRGAPAIAIVGCLSLAVELRAGAGGDDPVTFIRESLCHLTSARPTAVNMGRAARELMEFAENESMEKNSEQLRERWGCSRVAFSIWPDSPQSLPSKICSLTHIGVTFGLIFSLFFSGVRKNYKKFEKIWSR